MATLIERQFGTPTMKLRDVFRLRKREAARPSTVYSTRPPARIAVLQAEARVWAHILRRAEATIGDRDMAVVADDPDVHEAIDQIDFAALREFLEMIGRAPNLA